MAKIQHKRSKVTEGIDDVAKQPTAGQTAFGELCVNYSTKDPALFIKDDTQGIRRVGGDLSLYQKIEDLPPSVEISPNKPSNPEEGTLWWADTDIEEGGGRLYVYTGDEWVDVSLPGNGFSGEYNDLDGKPNLDDYLSSVNNDTAEGEITFEGLTTHEKGVKVTGGNAADVTTGLYAADNQVILTNGGNRFNLYSPGQATVGASIGGEINKDSNNNYGINSGFSFGGTTTNCSGFASRPDLENCTTNTWNDFRTEFRTGAAVPTNITRSFNYYVGSTVDYGTTLNAAFYSALRQGSGDKNFAFYAANQTPSYLSGNTHIGGTTARNTFELYKSTLTEEQLEQLEAGTLVAPANVSLPGDGEFARQWWYDQQSAEDQALIDSGELEYPTHLAAATFTDTFALGDNTAINLLSNGRGEFAAGVKVTGGGATGVNNGLRCTNQENIRLVSDARDVLIASVDNVNANVSNVHFALGKSPNGDLGTDAQYGFRLFGTSETGPGSLQFYNGTQSRTQGSPSDILAAFDISIFGNDRGSTYTTDQIKGVAVNNITTGANQIVNTFYAFTNEANTDFLEPAQTNYGYYSFINNSSSGKTNYNFYAAGTAPSYFKGKLQIGSNTLNANWEDGNSNGTIIYPSTIRINTNQNDANVASLVLRRTGNNYPLKVINFYASDTNVGDISVRTAAIEINGLAGGPLILDKGADARLVTTTEEITNASAVVQQLQPVKINSTRHGFTAGALQPLFAEAVTGTADATEAIGTLTDWDGTELETAVVEPSAEELQYTEEVETDGVATMVTRTRTWTPSGNRPVYQGVDQTKLIPLLTKALQEALDKIETLETRLSDAGIA